MTIHSVMRATYVCTLYNTHETGNISVSSCKWIRKSNRVEWNKRLEARIVMSFEQVLLRIRCYDYDRTVAKQTLSK